MKIYRIYHKVDGYKAINTKNTKLEESFIKFGNEVDFSIYNGEYFNWSGESSDKITDYPFINGSTPVFSNKVFKLIEGLISSNCTICNIKVDGEEYKIVDAKTLSGILKPELSTIKYFKDGRIMNIKKYVFANKQNIPSIFRIPELKTFTFVTEEIIDTLKSANKLDGLNLEECEIV